MSHQPLQQQQWMKRVRSPHVIDVGRNVDFEAVVGESPRAKGNAAHPSAVVSPSFSLKHMADQHRAFRNQRAGSPIRPQSVPARDSQEKNVAAAAVAKRLNYVPFSVPTKEARDAKGVLLLKDGPNTASKEPITIESIEGQYTSTQDGGKAVLSSLQALLQQTYRLWDSAPETAEDWKSLGHTALSVKADITPIIRSLQEQVIALVQSCDSAATTAKASVAKFHAQNSELNETFDVLAAADDRIGELFAQLKQKQQLIATQAQNFDRRVAEMMKSQSINVDVETYRMEDVKALTDDLNVAVENLQVAERYSAERAVVHKRIETLTNAQNTLQGELNEAQEQLEKALGEAATARQELDLERTQRAVEKGVMAEEMRKLRRQGGAHTREKMARVLAFAANNAQRHRVWSQWMQLADLSRAAKATDGVIVEHKDTVAKHRSIEAQRRQELAALRSELHTKTQALDEKRLELTRALERIAAMKDQVANAARIEAEEKLRAGRDMVTITAEELQSHAMEAYNILYPVLIGVKQRMGLINFKTSPVRIYNDTDAVIIIVLRWINQYFRTLHTVISLDERLRVSRRQLAFLSIRLRPQINKLNRSLAYPGELFLRSLMEARLNGLYETMRKINALRIRLQSTRNALLLCANAEDPREIENLTAGIENDISDFQVRFQAQRSEEARMMVESFRSALLTGRGLRSLHSPRKAPQRLTILDASSKETETGALTVQSPRGALAAGHRAASFRSVSIGRLLRASEKHLHGGTGRVPSDPLQQAPGIVIGSVLPSTSTPLKKRSMLISQSDFTASCSVATSSVLQRNRIHRSQREHEFIAQEKAGKQPVQLVGAMKHFVAHANAVIPFRSSTTRKAPVVPDPDPNEPTLTQAILRGGRSSSAMT